MSENKAKFIITLAVLAVSLPFINRAFFVDDFYHFTMAQGILQSPLRPYDFKSDDTKENIPSWEKNSFPRMVNPPLMHYYLAAVIKLAGAEEYKLRIGFLLFPLLFALSAYLLAKRFTKYALEAVLLVIFSQAFWLTSYSLMIDMVSVSLFLAGFELFIRGCEKDSFNRIASAGLLLGLAPMAKYTVYSGYLFVLLWLLTSEFSAKKKLYYAGVFILPVLIAVIWGVWNILTYGEPHMLAALKRSNSGSTAGKLIAGLIFTSGASIYSIFYALAVFKTKKVFAVLTFIFIGLLVWLVSPYGGFSFTQSLIMALLIITSLAVFCVLGSGWKKYNFFMLAWFFLGLFFILMPIPWLAGRYFLFIALPFAVLTVETLGRYFSDSNRPAANFVLILFTCCFGLSTALSDYLQADVYRRIAFDTKNDPVVTRHKGNKIIFGDAFFGYTYYLKKHGWQVVYNQGNINKGDLFLVSTHSIPYAARPRMDIKLKALKDYVYKTAFPLRVMDLVSSAGFYASAGGALPFSISDEALDVFILYEVM